MDGYDEEVLTPISNRQAERDVQRDAFIVLLGKTGHGKSIAGNYFAKTSKFIVSDKMDSCTNDVQTSDHFTYPDVCDYRLFLTDTPGLLDSRGRNDQEMDQKNLGKVILALRKNLSIRALFLCVNYQDCRFDSALRQAFTLIFNCFGTTILQNTALIFTRAPILNPDLNIMVKNKAKEFCKCLAENLGIEECSINTRSFGYDFDIKQTLKNSGDGESVMAKKLEICNKLQTTQTKDLFTWINHSNDFQTFTMIAPSFASACNLDNLRNVINVKISCQSGWWQVNGNEIVAYGGIAEASVFEYHPVISSEKTFKLKFEEKFLHRTNFYGVLQVYDNKSSDFIMKYSQSSDKSCTLKSMYPEDYPDDGTKCRSIRVRKKDFSVVIKSTRDWEPSEEAKVVFHLAEPVQTTEKISRLPPKTQ